MIYGNIFRDVLGCFNLMSSIPWNRTSKDENDIEALMLTQDKNLRCITTLTGKIIITLLGNSPKYPEKNVKVLSPGRLN